MASLTHIYLPRHRYIPKTRQTEENLFIEEYYSSTDTKIYIDDIEQTEISYISYSLNEQLKPIFGYESNTFDDVAIGTRIVTGVLKTPICNSSPQSTIEDIKARALSVTYGDTIDSTDDYNESESSKSDNSDWLGSTNKDNDSTGANVNNSTNGDDETIDSEYITKLEKLELFEKEPEEVIVLTPKTPKEMIKLFQDMFNLNRTGILDWMTKNAIDKLTYIRNTCIEISIPEGTMIYAQPAQESRLYEVKNETKVSVLTTTIKNDGDESEWLWVSAYNGIGDVIIEGGNKNEFAFEGYIDLTENPKLKEEFEKVKENIKLEDIHGAGRQDVVE